MNAAKSFITFLFLLAAVLLGVFIFYPVPTEDELEAEPRPQIIVVDPVIEADTTEIITYKTSKNQFTIDVPSDWTVEQVDAGGLSVIEIFNPEEEDVILNIYLGNAQSFDGVPISLEDWTNEQLIEASELQPCEDDEYGGEVVQCFIAVFDDVPRETYFGNLDTLTHFYIAKDQEEFKATPLQGVLNTIDFHPSKEDLNEAERIR